MLPDNMTLEGLETFLDSDSEEDKQIAEIDVEQDPGRTYKLTFGDEKHVLNLSSGIDGTDAIKQAVYKILMTERYENEIYSWDYGIELKDLYGQNAYYAAEELESRIEEALLVDNRIQGIANFEYEFVDKNTIKVSFWVETIDDDSFVVSKEVDI